MNEWKMAWYPDTVPVPEPLTLLGAATAVGMGAVFKRNSKQKKK